MRYICKCSKRVHTSTCTCVHAHTCTHTLLASWYYDKYSKIINSDNQQRFVLAYVFAVQSRVSWSCCSGPLAQQNSGRRLWKSNHCLQALEAQERTEVYSLSLSGHSDQKPPARLCLRKVPCLPPASNLWFDRNQWWRTYGTRATAGCAGSERFASLENHQREEAAVTMQFLFS